MTAPLADEVGPGGATAWVQELKRAASPLVVDLDGTLTPTNTLVESVIRLVKQSPVNLLRFLPLLFVIYRANSKYIHRIACQPFDLPSASELAIYQI